MDINQSTRCGSASNPTRGKEHPAYATVPEWCRLSGVGRSTTYGLLGAGLLRAKKLGARTLIDVVHGWTACRTRRCARMGPSTQGRRLERRTPALEAPGRIVWARGLDTRTLLPGAAPFNARSRSPF